MFLYMFTDFKIVTDQEVNDSGLRVGQEAILFFHLDMVPSNGVKFTSVFFDAKKQNKNKNKRTGFKLKNIFTVKYRQRNFF